MTKLFQIYEHDLASLERECAALSDELDMHLKPRQKRRVRIIKEILSNVRWNYGPPLECEVVPNKGEQQTGGDE